MGRVKKLAVIGPIESLKKVVSKIASLGFVELENYEGSLKRGAEIPEKAEVADLIVRLRSLASSLADYYKGSVGKARVLKLSDAIKEARKLVEEIEPKLVELHHRSKDIERELRALEEDLNLFRKLAPELDLGIFESENISVFAGKVLNTHVEELKERVSSEVPHAILFVQPLEEGWSFVIAGTLREEEEKLRKIFEGVKFVGIDIPRVSGKVKEIVEEMKAKLIRLEKERKRIREMLEKLARNYPRILQLLEMLESYHRLMEGAERAGVSERIFVLEMWVPSNRVEELKKELKKVESSLEFFELDFDEDEAPVIYETSRIFKPFYSIISLVGPPSHESFDPIVSVAFFFPIFFGMMLGDIGYGLLLILVSLFLGRKMDRLFESILGKPFRNFSKVLFVAGLSSFFFGVLFGEFFGNLGHYLGIKPVLFDRLEGVDKLLKASAIAGLLHLNLGLLFGLISELHHDWKRAIFGKGSWFLLQLSALLIYLGNTLGFFTLALSLFLMGRFEGLNALLEIPGFVGNIFSYMRLAAIGLSSAGIALAVNILAERFGRINLALGVLIFLFGHALNFVLGILDPFIQATRLHLVEFFSKFYEPAKRIFTPFTLERKYTGGEVIWS